MHLPSSAANSNAPAFEAVESLQKSTTPRSGRYLRAQTQYQLRNFASAAGPVSSAPRHSKSSYPTIMSSPTPLSRQPSNYRHGPASIFPGNMKSITSSVISENRIPSSFSAAAASTNASQIPSATIAGPVFASLHPRATWQRLEVDSMASPRIEQTAIRTGASSKTVRTLSPQRQRKLEGSGGVAPKSNTTARECVVEARGVINHFVNGTCSEAEFCSVIERSACPARIQTPTLCSNVSLCIK